MITNVIRSSSRLWWSLLLTLLAGYAIPDIQAEQLQPIFNGTNLAGWTSRGGKGRYEVQAGVIVGSVVEKGGGNTFLCTEREYGDFILELEIKADPELNSGVQIRSHAFDHETTYDFGARTIKIPANRVHGYQVEVDHRPERRWSGGIYEEGRREWLFPLATNSPAGQAFKFGEWNKYRIVCIGDSIKTWINGVPAADLVDAVTLKGFIGLQVHATDKVGLQVRFRNIQLEDLGEHQWQTGWNGENLDATHVAGKGSWKIENGVLHGSHSAADQAAGRLVTDYAAADFTVRLKFKASQGSSGFCFRATEQESGLFGLAVPINAENGSGGLQDSARQTWLSEPDAASVKKWFKPKEWNSLTVSAHEKRVVVHLNGHQSAELFKAPGPTAGHFALQLHGQQDVDVSFKEIEILAD